MPDSQNSRVAVYLDFDNIVISWYDRVHGRNSYGRDRQRIIESPEDPEIAERLTAATIDVGAIIDYAASFGTLVLTRAYADWSSPVNAVYRNQLVARAVDLVQLFPAAAYAKNGADIRLAVDTVEDMFRLPDLTHVVIVAGDSDYVPLAQRCRRLGRYVVGVGVAGSTAKSLAAACDEFEAYDSLPGVPRPARVATKDAGSRAPARGSRSKSSAAVAADPAVTDAPTPPTMRRRRPLRARAAPEGGRPPRRMPRLQRPRLQRPGLLRPGLRIPMRRLPRPANHPLPPLPRRSRPPSSKPSARPRRPSARIAAHRPRRSPRSPQRRRPSRSSRSRRRIRRRPRHDCSNAPCDSVTTKTTTPSGCTAPRSRPTCAAWIHLSAKRRSAIGRSPISSRRASRSRNSRKPDTNASFACGSSPARARA